MPEKQFMDIFVRTSGDMAKELVAAVLMERDMRKIVRTFDDELENYYKSLNKAYKDVYGEDLITFDLDDKKNLERLFKQGGVQNIMTIKLASIEIEQGELDEEDGGSRRRRGLIALAIGIPAVIITIIVTLIIVFKCCLKRETVNGRKQWVCKNKKKTDKH